MEQNGPMRTSTLDLRIMSSAANVPFFPVQSVAIDSILHATSRPTLDKRNVVIGLGIEDPGSIHRGADQFESAYHAVDGEYVYYSFILGACVKVWTLDSLRFVSIDRDRLYFSTV